MRRLPIGERRICTGYLALLDTPCGRELSRFARYAAPISAQGEVCPLVKIKKKSFLSLPALPQISIMQSGILINLARVDIMNTKKLLLIAFSLLLAQGCNETQNPDTGEHSTPLSCISFTDTAFGIYAMSNWDTDHNGCLTVPEAQSVQSLPDSAFAGNTTLQSLNDLNSVPNLTVIGNNAFAGCTSLVSANLPNIKTVGNNAFAGCTSLVSVQLPNASSISDNAFEGCTNLTNIVGPVTQNTCTGGALKCSNNNAQVLICMNNQWMTKENCANGCSNGTCISAQPPKTCTKGTLKCSDDNAQVLLCKNNKWISLASCANGCENGVCISTTPAKTCTEGAQKCSADNAQALMCLNDQWVTKENCENGCTNGVCVSIEPPKICDNNALKCSDDNTQALLCLNNQWVAKENCQNGCENGTCINTPEPTCTNGAVKCSDDGKQALVCKNKAWTTKEKCANGCADGMCKSPATVCVEGNKKCSAENSELLICKNNAWVTGEVCANKCNNDTLKCNDASLNGACDNEGQLRCSDDLLKKCVNKQWEVYEECELGCQNDKCNICQPNKHVCGTTLNKPSWEGFICDGQKWIYDDICTGWAVDCNAKSGYCETCRKDQEGELWCNGDVIFQCTNLQWHKVEVCSEFRCGVEETPVRCYTSPYNQFKCSDDHTKSLYSNGFGWKVVEECGGSPCSDETGKCHDKIFFCGNHSLSDIKFDWYMSFMPLSDDITEDKYNYDDFVTNHPTGTFNQWCAQFDNRIGVCQEYSNHPKYNWKNYFGGDCFLPCSAKDEGKAFTTCEHFDFGDNWYLEPYYFNFHGINASDIMECNYTNYLDIASRYVCTKIGNQYVYYPVESVNACICGNNQLCSLLSYNSVTKEYESCKE